MKKVWGQGRDGSVFKNDHCSCRQAVAVVVCSGPAAGKQSNNSNSNSVARDLFVYTRADNTYISIAMWVGTSVIRIIVVYQCMSYDELRLCRFDSLVLWISLRSPSELAAKVYLLSNFQRLVISPHREIGGRELHTHTHTHTHDNYNTVCLLGSAHRGIITDQDTSVTRSKEHAHTLCALSMHF